MIERGLTELSVFACISWCLELHSTNMTNLSGYMQLFMWKTTLKSMHSQMFGIYFNKKNGVGPVDNRPSPAKLHHFVREKINKLWHMTCDTWHVTHDMWHVTCDIFGEVNILSKFQLPSSYCLWFMIIWRSGGKGSLN